MSRARRLRDKKRARVVHERTRTEKEPQLIKKVFPFLGIIIVGAVVYLLLFSDAFKISEVTVEGYSDPHLIEEIIENQVAESRFGDNLILFNKKRLREAAKEDSRIRSIFINKRYPDILKIEVVESFPAIIWISAGESFEIDDRGYVISENKKGEDLPVVYDSLNIETSLGERVASPTFINYIKKLDENFDSIVGSKMKKITVYDILSDVRVKSDDSWTAYFNSGKDPISQMNNLVQVLSEIEREGARDLEYIDMRLEDRIFYK